MPLRMEGIEGVREEGNEDKDACRVRLLLALGAVPFVEGRYDKTDDMALQGEFMTSSESAAARYASKRVISEASLECLYARVSLALVDFIASFGHSRQMLMLAVVCMICLPCDGT